MIMLVPMGPVAAVFSLDDTEGPELPEMLTRVGTFDGHWDPQWLTRLIENARRHRIRVDFRSLSSTNKGFATWAAAFGEDKLRIVIDDALVEPSRFGILCHEMAHVLLGHLGSDDDRWWPSRSHLGRSTIEIEAETTAHIVTRRLGLEGASAEYISAYLGKDGTVPRGVSFDTIAKVAGKIERMTRSVQARPRPRRRRRRGT